MIEHSIFEDYPELDKNGLNTSESIFKVYGKSDGRSGREMPTKKVDKEINYDDPIWEYTVVSKLNPYLPYIRRFWKDYDKYGMQGTGVFDFIFDKNETPINGLYVRCTSTPVRSPIKHVQMFPFVPTAYLQLSGIPGGANRMVERVCRTGLKIDELTVIEKHNLPSTYHKGQFLAVVPTAILQDTRQLGKYIYLTTDELATLACGIALETVQEKCKQYIK